MDRDRNYYTLKSSKKNFGHLVLSFLLTPFKLPSWIISILVARYVTHIVLNPGSAPLQRAIHLTKLNDKEQDDIVVINFKKTPKVKWFNDFLLKFSHIFSFIPFISPQLRNRVNYSRSEDILYVNNLLEEIDKLIKGTSNARHCEGKVFDWSHIHFKGMEFLDAKMRVYFYEQLDKKYGVAAYNKKNAHSIEFFTVQTADNSELDSVEVLGPNEEQKPISERKFVITCLARDQNYINWLKDLKYTATNLGATAICFNYRGIDLSRGIVWTEQDMVDDVLAQTQRLIELGAKPENICIDGMCLGGAIATLSAAQLHEQKLKVKLNNERSFRSLPQLLFGFIAPEMSSVNWWNPLTYLRFFAAGLIYVLITPFLWLGGWYTNAEKAWDKIPTEDKMYSVIRDEKNHIYDGVINDYFSSIASLVDYQFNAILKKVVAKVPLNEKEMAILNEYVHSNPSFKPSEEVIASEKYRGPHFVSRRDLVAELGHQKPYTNHDYFLNKLKDKFTVAKLLEDSALSHLTAPKQTSSSFPEQPLILACSGGTGHISAAKGIINEVLKKNPQAVIPQYEASLYKHHPFALAGFFIRLGVWAGSIPVLRSIVNFIAHRLGAPSMPNYHVFWEQMEKIKRSETVLKNGKEQGMLRPYIDVLLDLFAAGYEFTAYNNAAHLSLTSKDTMTMSTYKGSVEGHNHASIFKGVIGHLIGQAQNGTPYTQVISTQALSLKAICDAVLYYNNSFLPTYNETHKTSYPALSIAQYMTDLPSLGCAHFMDNLENLTYEQRQLIELHAVYMSEPIKASYFDTNHGFKAIHEISPKQNPMVRAAFKAPTLNTYTELDKSCMLTYRANTDAVAAGFINKSVEIKAGEKSRIYYDRLFSRQCLG